MRRYYQPPSITGGGILELKGKGVVKSVQRGAVDNTPGQSGTWIDVVSISPIELEKSVLFINMFRTSSGATNIRFSLTHNTIQAIGSSGIPAFAWQVIEFY